MFDKLTALIKKYLFLEGVAMGVMACVWFYESFRIDQAKEGFEAEVRSANAQTNELKTRYDLTKERLQESLAFQDKYQGEQLLRKEAEVKLSKIESERTLLSNELSSILAQKWEEKFKAELLSSASLRQELKSAKEREAKVAVDAQAKTNPSILHEIQRLNEQVKLLESERDKLRELYSGKMPVKRATIVTEGLKSGARQIPPKPQYTDGEVLSRARSSGDADRLCASLAGMAMMDVGRAIIEGAEHVSGGIPAGTFIKMLNQAAIMDRGGVVKKCASFIQRPLTPDEISQISKLVASFDSADAMKALTSSN
jgi:hypothetical protein